MQHIYHNETLIIYIYMYMYMYYYYYILLYYFLYTYIYIYTCKESIKNWSWFVDKAVDKTLVGWLEYELPFWHNQDFGATRDKY